MKTYTQYLRCQFTEQEITDKAKDLACANRKRTQIEQQKREVDTQLKADIEVENSKIARLSEHISTGFEYRDVECRVDLDTPEEGQKRIVRLDTGEEVLVALMTDEDKQLALDLAEQGEGAE